MALDDVSNCHNINVLQIHLFGSEGRNRRSSPKQQSNSVYPSLISLQTLLGGKQDFYGTSLRLIDPSYFCVTAGEPCRNEARQFSKTALK